MHLSESASTPALFWLAPLIILLPVLGMLVNLAVGRRMSERFVGWIASSAIGLAFVVALTQAAALLQHPEGATVRLASWLHIGDFVAEWAMQDRHALGDHDADGDGRQHAHPYLCHGLYARGRSAARRSGALHALLRVLQLVRGVHDDPGHGRQLPDDVRRLGGRRAVFVPADWLLVRGRAPKGSETPWQARRPSSPTASATLASWSPCS